MLVAGQAPVGRHRHWGGGGQCGVHSSTEAWQEGRVPGMQTTWMHVSCSGVQKHSLEAQSTPGKVSNLSARSTSSHTRPAHELDCRGTSMALAAALSVSGELGPMGRGAT